MKSIVEIDGARLTANFRAVQTAVGPGFEVLAVIKADAYGHGATLCAPVLRDAGAHWLGVTDAEEGVAVRAALDEDRERELTRLLVMTGFEPGDAEALVEHDLTPVVWTPEHLRMLESAAKLAGRRVRVHLEVDTGMARQGVAPEGSPGAGLAEMLDRLHRSPWLLCEGVLTHLACAEVSGAAETAAAERRFLEVKAALGRAGLFPELLHIGNTSSVDEGGPTRWMAEHFTQYRLLPDNTLQAYTNATAMVRPGLAMYGYSLPLVHSEKAESMPPRARQDLGAGLHPQLCPELRPVMTWKAPVIDLRDIRPGAAVGYGATFRAERPMRLALLAAGYADGFRREASSRPGAEGTAGSGWVMLAGRRAPVVGRVSMNLTVVDVTELEGVAVGDKAVLLGESVTAEDHARWAGTIPYEILCGVRGRRVLV